MLPSTASIQQNIHTVESFPLECGVVLKNIPIAYKTWGSLNKGRDNVMIICHAFTGSADVEDWWGPLMGPGKAFDPRRYFIFCANVLGSPYGTASPITINPETGRHYGPEFPPTTIRDDVRLHKLVLDYLEVNSVAVAIGGSMGGMAVLEWPLCSSPGYIRQIVPLATSASHSAWCISWGEAQRQCIFSDPGYRQGFYETQPASGLAAARMSAMLTYRSRDSFERRFGRKPQVKFENAVSTVGRNEGMTQVDTNVDENRGSERPGTTSGHLALHNDGYRDSKLNFFDSPTARLHTVAGTDSEKMQNRLPHLEKSRDSTLTTGPSIFSAQSYLRYQGDKFIARFDANCYIHITRKLDTHDVARGRGMGWRPSPLSVFSSASASDVRPTVTESLSSRTDDAANLFSDALTYVLSLLPRGALVISIASDVLFTTSEQRELAEHIPEAELVVIPSSDGHDGFLLEFEAINRCVLNFLRRMFPQYYRVDELEGGSEDYNDAEGKDFEITKSSVFGEAEVDIVMW